MAINLAEIGASCSVDAGGTLQITFGLDLPGSDRLTVLAS
jgi:hypothetical protein